HLIDAGVEMRKDLQGGRHDLKRNSRHRELASGGFDLFAEPLAELLELGYVGLIVLSDASDGQPGTAQVLRGFAANAAHRLNVHFAPLGEIRKRYQTRHSRSGAWGNARLYRRNQRLGVVANIFV